jgi:hypothetical protein
MPFCSGIRMSNINALYRTCVTQVNEPNCEANLSKVIHYPEMTYAMALPIVNAHHERVARDKESRRFKRDRARALASEVRGRKSK